jgi:plasmid stabilization system protein ParE
MRIEWTEEAAAELDRMLAYIAAQDVSAAALVAGRVLRAEDNIRTFPRAGRYDHATDTFDRFIPNTRIVLTYTLREGNIWIVSVWHTSRNPETRTKGTKER